jgi:hypothetical protein
MLNFYFNVLVIIIIAWTIECFEEVNGDLIAEKEGG